MEQRPPYGARLDLVLYVTGNRARSFVAIANVRRICEERAPGAYDLTIIDVLKDPESAEREKVLATPTLIRRRPLPVHRIVGDFSRADGVDDLLAGGGPSAAPPERKNGG